MAAVLLAGIALGLWFSRPPVPHLLCQGKPLQIWIVENSSGDPKVRPALLALGTNAVPELMLLVETKDPFPTKQLWTLASRLPTRAQKFLLPRLHPPQADRIRAVAAQWLGILGHDATPAVPILARALHDPNETLCWSAATALGRIGTSSLPALIAALQSRKKPAQEAATFAVAFLGPAGAPAIPALVRNLRDPDPQIRAASASTLGQIGAPAKAARQELNRLAEDNDAAVRFAAKDTLTRIKEPPPANQP